MIKAIIHYFFKFLERVRASNMKPELSENLLKLLDILLKEQNTPVKKLFKI